MKEKERDTQLRLMVLDILVQTIEKKEYSHKVIRSVLNKSDYLDTKDKALVKRMAEGTLERLTEIDYILNLYSKVKVKKMKPIIRNILRMGVYQILFMDGVYDTQGCNEAVKIATIKGFTGLKGYVNGVLRTIAREKDKIPYPDESMGTEYLAIKYSMPAWLIDMWNEQYGEKITQLMLPSFLEEKKVTFRVDENLSKELKQDLINKIESKAGVEVISHPYLNYAYRIKGMDNIQMLPGFDNGEIIVQDVASMLVAEVVGIRGGEQVLDVCAAPGGKTLHVACKLNGTGVIEARDISEQKVDLIRENVERSRYGNIHCSVLDATVWDIDSEEKYDVVIADLPCSGLGVIGKKSDIKYNVSPKQLEELTQLQRSILEVVASYVKQGGTLVFSTCTINKTENSENAAWFVANFPFERVDFIEQLPEQLKSNVTCKGELQLFPGITECDGFFIAVFKKK